MAVSLGHFAISWKASRNDARGKPPNKPPVKLCIGINISARQGVTGHRTRPSLKKDPLPSGEEKAYEIRLLPLPGGRSV
jgi:hypothetical protein